MLTVYVIVTVPASLPNTWPEVLTLAIVGALLFHTPPLMSLTRFIVAFTHTAFGPLIVAAEGSGFTIISADALAVPQPVVIV